jgi:hypothetical protein
MNIRKIMFCGMLLFASVLSSAVPLRAENLRGILWETGRRIGLNPIATLELLARVESNLNPLAIHLSSRSSLKPILQGAGVPHTSYLARGRYHYSLSPRSRQQAEAVLRWAAKHREISYDVGLLQIWRGNVESRGLDPLDLLDPIKNALVGGLIFRECHDRYGEFWRAVECYHHGHYKGRTTYYSRNVYRAIQAMLQEYRAAASGSPAS